jgi:hypothetical protein
MQFVESVIDNSGVERPFRGLPINESYTRTNGPAINKGWNTLSFPVSDQSFWNDFLQSSEFQFPTDISLPNFLLELGDVDRTINGLRDLMKRGANSARDLNPVDARKDSRSAHYTVGFGLGPLMRDVQDLLNTHSKFENRLRWIKKNNGRNVPIRKREIIEGVPKGPHVATAIKWLPGTYTRTRVVGARLSIDLADLDDALGRLAAGLHHMGFNNPGAVLWEAIPFSWAVDYFLDLKALTHQYAQKTVFSGTWKISDGYHSHVSEHTWNFEYGPWSRYFLSKTRLVVPQQEGGTCVTKTYSREPGIPSTSGIIVNSGPKDWNQHVNLLRQLF